MLSGSFAHHVNEFVSPGKLNCKILKANLVKVEFASCGFDCAEIILSMYHDWLSRRFIDWKMPNLKTDRRSSASTESISLLPAAAPATVLLCWDCGRL